MSLGLEGAYGANEFQKALRQKVMDDLAQKQQEFQNAMATRGADRADRALGQQDTLTRLKIQELADAKASTEADQQFKIGTQLSNTIPAGTVLSPDNPSVKPLQALGAVKEQTPTLPSTSSIGVMQAPTGDGVISGRLVSQTRNAGNPRQFVKLPSQAESVQASTAGERHVLDEAHMQALTAAAEHATQMANIAGASAEARNAAASAQAELARARLEFQQQQAATKQDQWMPTGDTALDPTGNSAFVFRNGKGEIKLVAPPPGSKIERPPQGGGIADWWRSMFGSAPTTPKQIRYGPDGKPL